MEQSIRIRPASVGDVAAICPLLQQLGYDLSPDVLSEKLSRDVEGRFAFVAEVDGRIVAFMTLHMIDWFHRSDAAARLSALVVDSSQRRKGVGRALIAFAERAALERGCTYIELTSNLRRKADGTYEFYASLGYRAAQEQTTYFRKPLRQLAS